MTFRMTLAGEWGFALDSERVGIQEQWYEQQLKQVIQLPGSTDEYGYGTQGTAADTYKLNRRTVYVGAAWYQRTIVIPEAWAGKHILLMLERCLWETTVWIDDVAVGSQKNICTPHIYDLSGVITPGVHLITMRVDNSQQVDIGTWGHGWSEEVQTLWNGIVGKIDLSAQDPVYLEDVQVYPDVATHTAHVVVVIKKDIQESVNGAVRITVREKVSGEVSRSTLHVQLSDANTHLEAALLLGEDTQLWDEYAPHLYELEVQVLTHGSEQGYRDQKQITFGMRAFTTSGSQFQLNGRAIFLRGTHDAGNFPLTGYPSTDIDEWRRIYRIAQSYGLNHFRFHSWCPPEAAFLAADEAGIILQAELPFFNTFFPPRGQDPFFDAYVQEELDQILRQYGNHPSFCLFSLGNELKGDPEHLTWLVEYSKTRDARHLYTSITNNASLPAIGIQPNLGDQYYVAHEARLAGERVLRRGELVFNSTPPETAQDYRATLQGIAIPTVSHEVGQWLVYPDIAEIPAYTGVVQARNLEVFRDLLNVHQMLDQAGDFVQASGALSLLLYREEIERSLRTPGYGGFQLLDIHDYPGQGTSTVGWLNAFWESKGLIQPERFRRFCQATVVLLRVEKRVWTTDETFAAQIDCANYGPQRIEAGTLLWSIKDQLGQVYAQGQDPFVSVVQGGVAPIGRVTCALAAIPQASKLTIEVSLAGTEIGNDWDFWVYPSMLEVAVPAAITVASEWSVEVEACLEAGGNVLLLAGRLEEAEHLRFTPPFWNTQLFADQPKTLGLLCDPRHPALAAFPTDFHTDWQWWDLVHDAACFRFPAEPAAFRPIVQVIDHPIRNQKLGVLFEARVRRGKLLACSLDLRSDLARRPVARQLLASLLAYMETPQFVPPCQLDARVLRELLHPREAHYLSRHTVSVKANQEALGCEADKILDGEWSTFWATGNYSVQSSSYPHEIIIELDAEVEIDGFLYRPRQDGKREGWIASYAFFLSADGHNWGEPLLQGTFQRDATKKVVRYHQGDDSITGARRNAGKFVRFVACAGFEEDMIAAIGAFDILTSKGEQIR